MREKVIVICGPTAVGKTQLSIQLAKKFDGEVINGDAMQIYQHLDIATAKASLAERQGVPHHLLDIRQVDQNYSVAEFKADGQTKIHEISQRNHLPIVVGGTGLYLEALIYDLSLGNKAAEDPDYRQQLTDYANNHGNQALHDKLQSLDPQAADKIHVNNVRRVIRALEVCKATGQKFSDQQETHHNHQSPYDLFIIGLNTDRQLLYERINQRVDLMLDQGLLDEAQWLLNQDLPADQQSMKAIGYKEIFPYLKGEISLDAASQDLKQASRRYAKRQLTWIRNRLTGVHYYDLVTGRDRLADIEADLDEYLKGGHA
ncbi:tRNA dimethylallyltransferase [Aerococcus urinaehominis]|uniref:tRNA dimethylallyltransferase n=1 Tax=Aerococcus urinaehominis TaxID=128944 RepID=A0A109RGL3_9LACT|nr:tRNA (adenosine(37)-N6)-dimethylallyltransferase MiaA [Aerococcus urinaehominis]AMB98856.1 tRNA dimethylallyltransferase [Aerococcus urinaehominis]SDM17126.1 tRNA dimethylallyltransferase [Aerococcus urinaehominis]